jgi:chromosome segregation ATPase
MDSETGLQLKASRCRLVAVTNEVLKIASNNANFSICYLDLLNPKRNCFLSCFQFLTNYVIFFDNAYKEVKKCHQLIRDRVNLRSQKNHMRKMIEDMRISEEQSVKQTRDIERKIPQLQAQVATLQNREDILRKDIEAIHKKMEETDINVDELKAQCDSIGENIISDQEAESILQSREQVQVQLDEQEEIINAGRLKLKENSATIDRVQSVTSKMEHIISTSNFDTSDLKQLKQNLENLKAAAHELKDVIRKNSQEIKNLEKTGNFKKENVTKLFEERNEAKMKFNTVLRDHSNEIKQKLIIVKDLQAKEDQQLDEKLVIKDEMDLLYTVVSNVIKQMSESFFDQGEIQLSD